MPGEEDDYRASKDPLYKASVGTFASLDKPAALLRCEIFILSVCYNQWPGGELEWPMIPVFVVAPEIMLHHIFLSTLLLSHLGILGSFNLTLKVTRRFAPRRFHLVISPQFSTIG